MAQRAGTANLPLHGGQVPKWLADRMTPQASTQEVPGSLLPDNAPTETLLKTLAGYNGAFERVDAGMQDIVDILREREVSGQPSGRPLPCRVRRHGSALGEAKRHSGKRLVCTYFLNFERACAASGASRFRPLRTTRHDLRNAAQFAFSRKELGTCFDATADG